LSLGNDVVEFQARFGGMPREVYVPIARVIAIYARENGQGMAFEVARGDEPTGTPPVSAEPAAKPRSVEAPRERVGLVPVTPMTPVTSIAPVSPIGEASQSDDAEGEPPTTPPPPKPGDRPKLTRIK
jgi:stringent starvation protein B